MTSENADPTVDSEASRPVLRIVSGNPSDAELAAVTSVLAAVASAARAGAAASGTSAWSDLSLRLRRPLPAGPGAWQNSRWS
jgi:hypothetical protein